MPLTRHLSTRLGHVGRVAGQHFHPHPGLLLAKLYSQLASSILMLLLTLAKLYSQLASSILLGLAEPAHQVQAH